MMFEPTRFIAKEPDTVEGDALHIMLPNGKTHTIPPYGETKIVTHGGKVTFIETSVKEKVE